MAAKLVLGLGGTVDYEIAWDDAVIGALARQHGIRRTEVAAPAVVTDERSLILAILGFLAAGTGGELLVSSSEIIDQFCTHFTTAVTLGGTGVRAGLALERLGVPSVQHLVSIDDTVRRLLPASLRAVSSATRDTLDPHLIVQYPAGARVVILDAEIIAPAANRVIFANDTPNREMAIAVELRDELAEASAFLISGFNTMQDPALLRSRLRDLRQAMETLPAEALVYYEDAGFYDRALAHEARDALLGRIDVYGMNEDEWQEYVGRRIQLLDPDDVAGALTHITRLIPAPAVVVHTRAWAIAVGSQASRHRESLEDAVRLSGTRYRLGDTITAADVAATGHLPRNASGARLVERVAELVPGSVGVAAFDLAVEQPTTIGLGDTFVGGFLLRHGRDA